jgi:galactose-1-phosphate uridylyltransferase
MEISMSEKYEAANLILKLYELRREEVMRKARNWFIAEFNPESVQDFANVTMSDKSAYYRMVTTYWDMACSFVTNGAIDEQMFNDANAEHVAVYSKIEPFIAEIRSAYTNDYMKNVEKVVMGMPNAKERLATTRERLKMLTSKRSDAATT